MLLSVAWLTTRILWSACVSGGVDVEFDDIMLGDGARSISRNMGSGNGKCYYR